MDEIVGRVNSEARSIKTNAGKTLRKLIAANQEDFKSMIMMLAGGDVVQYNEIRKLSIEDFLVKMENYVNDIVIRSKK